MNAYRSARLTSLLILALLAGTLVACDGESARGGPYVWIDVPTDGLRVPVDREVRIEGHASHAEGVDRVEVWVGGDLHLVEEDPPTEGSLAHFDLLWMPPGAGEYAVEVVAIGRDGTGSEADTVRLFVGDAVAEATPVATEVPTAVPTAVPTDAPTDVPTAVPTTPPTDTPPPAGAVIQFWADAEQVAAGSCTTLHWHTENVQAVFYDGMGTAGDGSHQVCPCSQETHTLTVQLAGGSEETRSITINVSGSCATNTPPPDTTPPPAPQPLKPVDEQEYNCVSSLMLRWSPVTDPSGIGEYRVQVERHSGDSNWQTVAGSPWTGLAAPELELDVECGWYYRWRVRAVDGAGNAGPFSTWFRFTDWLA